MVRGIICFLIDLIGKVRLAQVILKSKSASHRINHLQAIIIIIIIQGSQMDSINGAISSTKTITIIAVLIKAPCRNVKAVMTP